MFQATPIPIKPKSTTKPAAKAVTKPATEAKTKPASKPAAKASPGAGKVRSESVEQIMLIARIRQFHPQTIVYAIPNGGKRSKITAARLKAEGVRSGVPDYCLPVARGGYHALYVELKTLTGRPSREQIDYIRQLEAAGNMCCVAKGWDQAQRCIVAYLQQSKVAS